MRVFALVLLALLTVVTVAYSGRVTEAEKLRLALAASETQLAAARIDAATSKQRLLSQTARLKDLEDRRDAIQKFELQVRFNEAEPPDSSVDPLAAVEPQTLHLLTRAELVGATAMPLVTRDPARVEMDSEGRAVSLKYELLDPEAWAGQPVPLLSGIHTLVIGSLPVLRRAGLRLIEGGTVVTIEVLLNGRAMGPVSAPISVRENDGNRGVVDVAQYFSGLPEAYARTQQPSVP